jgi:hypothetical protein
MNKKKPFFPLSGRLPTALMIFAALATQVGHASTLWTGPNITYSQVGPATAGTMYTGTPDVLIPGAVSIARNGNGPLYNPAAGETASDFSTSPADTMWAFSSSTSTDPAVILANLPPPSSFVTFASLKNGALFNVIDNRQMVVHLVSQDIYLALKFSNWNHQFHGGNFTYTRSTPAAVVAPTVSITNPAPGAVFAAPANVQIDANASVTGGTVTNVTFFNGSTPLGFVLSAPFDLTASNLTAGSYSLTAVAKASGLSATSSVVNITVVSPAAITATAPRISSGQFSFSYSADPGLTYVVFRSPDLVTWTPVATNKATANPVAFSDPVSANSASYYRVARLPNP